MTRPHPRISKAVIPAAGLGTRFLPATKAIPKEMLPVIDKPAIQYVIEEAATAGMSAVLMVIGRNKYLLEDHFDRNYELEETLARKGDHDMLRRVNVPTDLAHISYVRQGNPRGVGHAVLCAAPHVDDQPFAVLLGDDLIDPRDALLPRMIEAQERLGGSVIALLKVDPEQIHAYGCAAIEPAGATDEVRVTDVVEKPDPADAPSNYAVIGRFALDPAIFDVLRETTPGRGGEVQLTDALRMLANRDDQGGPVYGIVFSGRRYDTGDRADYLRATVRLACEREDLGPEFRGWLRTYVDTELNNHFLATS